MRERILAALVGLLIILPALIFGGQLAAEIVVGLVLLIGLDEYVAIVARRPARRGPSRWPSRRSAAARSCCSRPRA